MVSALPLARNRVPRRFQLSGCVPRWNPAIVEWDATAFLLRLTCLKNGASEPISLSASAAFFAKVINDWIWWLNTSLCLSFIVPIRFNSRHLSYRGCQAPTPPSSTHLSARRQNELLLFSCGLRQALPSLGNLLKLGKRAFQHQNPLRKPIAGLLSHITLFNR